MIVHILIQRQEKEVADSAEKRQESFPQPLSNLFLFAGTEVGSIIRKDKISFSLSLSLFLFFSLVIKFVVFLLCNVLNY